MLLAFFLFSETRKGPGGATSFFMEEINSKNSRKLFVVLISILVCFDIASKAAQADMEIPVGVVVDTGSWVGKTVYRCISIAISEFYAVNSHYKTRIVLHKRNTHGESLHALSAALDLVENVKVQAILGSESTSEAKLLGALADHARVPILSLSPIPSSNRHLYFLQITQDETTQVKAIASMASSFGWKNAIVIFEDNDNGRDMATCMTNSFPEKSITITYISPISTFASNEVLQEELYKLSNMQTKLYIIHASHPLASQIFKNAKYLGMMDAGYKWIVTSKTMDFLNFMGDEDIASMQGVVGFKSYIPQSRNLPNFTLKWRKEYDHVMELKNINTYVISAHDGVLALAMAVEKTKDQCGTTLLNHILRISFEGLSGNFKFMNTRVMTQVLEIVNVIGKEEVKVALWTRDDAFTKKIGKLNSFRNDDGLESIVWPGGISTSPTNKMLQVSGRRLRIGIPRKSRSAGNLFQVNYDAETNSTLVSGYCSDVFLAAFAGIDPNVSFQFIPSTNKSKLDEGRYNDLVYQVHAGEFDAAIGDITITANRSLYVDFTLPYTDLGLATLTRNGDAGMWIFIKPLSSDLWLVSACFFILLGFVIWILEHGTNDEFQGSPLQQIGVTLWFAFSTIVYAHRQKLERNLSRFVVTVWLFVVLVLVSSYTAALSSLLTVEQIQLASKRGLFGYRVEAIDAVKGVIVRNMNSNDATLKQYNTLQEMADALSSGSKKGGVDAIVDEIPYIKEFLARYPSGYSMSVSEDVSNGFGFAFPKGSPLIVELSRQIARLREDRTLQTLEYKWFGQQSNPQETPAVKVLNFKGLRGLFLISGISMAAARGFPIHACYHQEKVLPARASIHPS